MIGVTVSLNGRGRISATRADSTTGVQLVRDIDYVPAGTEPPAIHLVHGSH